MFFNILLLYLFLLVTLVTNKKTLRAATLFQSQAHKGSLFQTCAEKRFSCDTDRFGVIPGASVTA